MSESILTSVKQNLGLSEDYTAFDSDILLYINGVFSTLHQLGIGPQNGFEIADATPTWDAFIGGQRPLNAVKTYVYLRVRLLFDPPGTSYLVDALNNQIKEHEWRLNQLREETMWTDPTGTLVLSEGAILDGGSP